MIGIITSTSKLVGINYLLLLSICTTESGLTNVVNLKDRGAPSYGICQVKQSTAEFVMKRPVTIKELMTPEKNILFAAKYIKYQTLRYNKERTSDCIVAAYNAGRCKRNEKGKIKNHKYVKKVWSHYGYYQKGFRKNKGHSQGRIYQK